MVGWGVGGPAGDPAFTWVEKGEDAGMDEDVTESELVCTLLAGRRTSCGSYGQLSETVVVKGIKKFSNDVKGFTSQSLSRSLGLA